jgi:hypothetical protein
MGLDSSAIRARMVQKLSAQGIDDAVVLEAMGRVERHRFVDSALVNQAYEDTSLPIGLGQTISKPNVVARMIALLREAPGLQGAAMMGRVLEIGTGCGYQAAVLACVAREVMEETNVEVRDLRYFGSQSWPFPNSLMIAFTAEYAGGELRHDPAELADAQWFPLDALPHMPPSLSIARALIDATVTRMRRG